MIPNLQDNRVHKKFGDFNTFNKANLFRLVWEKPAWQGTYARTAEWHLPLRGKMSNHRVFDPDSPRTW